VLLREGDDGAAAMRGRDRRWGDFGRLSTLRRDVAAGIRITLEPQQLRTQAMIRMWRLRPVSKQGYDCLDERPRFCSRNP